MAGWQRGGFLAERVLWIAVGVVLVVAAHLLPALIRSHGWRVRLVGVVLWIGCMAGTCYGHAVFFLLAQKHAGEVRAATVPTIVTTGRNPAVIAADRAAIVSRLARVTERRCVEPCPSLRIERATLAARLDAIDAEATEAKRQEAAQDRSDAARATAVADPVTGAVTAFGIQSGRVDLVAGLAFAAVLEAVACFCWLLAFRPVESLKPNIGAAVTPVTEVSNDVTEESIGPAPAVEQPVIEAADDVTRVMTEIAAGRLRATVTDIRKHLGCSQSRAAAIRKQIA
ncbi:hypothetical protein [Paraburkholderia terrae]|uniref:hypothetical protein n=1 Tax=Paraburkholderia terrae TaxID=311230 RepID=UPI001EE276FB|nr:hypothetical protein [Paraburkholderia terrae]GJH05000.1 hypothetical protein CBA19C8_30605 [Paraburkholderia terrae]